MNQVVVVVVKVEYKIRSGKLNSFWCFLWTVGNEQI